MSINRVMRGVKAAVVSVGILGGIDVLAYTSNGAREAATLYGTFFGNVAEVITVGFSESLTALATLGTPGMILVGVGAMLGFRAVIGSSSSSSGLVVNVDSDYTSEPADSSSSVLPDREYPLSAFGVRRRKWAERDVADVSGECLNCGKPFDAATRVVNHYAKEAVALGAPLHRLAGGEVHECERCHEAGTVEYALRAERDDPDTVTPTDDLLAESESLAEREAELRDDRADGVEPEVGEGESEYPEYPTADAEE